MTHTHQLNDGAALNVRPLRPDDRPQLEKGFERLSETSRYFRFMAPVNRLTERQLDYLTDLDQIDHFAWGVQEPPDQGGAPVAVARYVRLTERPGTAEAAITVVDDFQGRGLGRLAALSSALVGAAQRRHPLRTLVLAENRAMIALLSAFGAEIGGRGPGSRCRP